MTPTSRRILRAISYCGLALSFIPSLMVYHGMIDKEAYFKLIAAGMVLWFGSAVWWIRPDHVND